MPDRDSVQFRRYLNRAERELRPMIEGSAVTVCINPGDGPDAKAAIELGYMILLDKPIIVVNVDDRPIADRLRRVADIVIAGDLTDPAIMAEIRDAIARLSPPDEAGP